MPVSRFKRVNSPRNIIIKYNNGDKDSKTVQRKKTGHIKNKKLKMAYFSIAKLEGLEARQCW